MLSRASTRSFPPGGLTFSVRRHTFQASLVFPYHLATHPKPLGATPVASLFIIIIIIVVVFVSFIIIIIIVLLSV